MLNLIASFNERLLLGNGLCVKPLKPQSGDSGPRSLSDVVFQIDNARDLNSFVSILAPKIGATNDIKYERHPVQVPDFIPTYEQTDRMLSDPDILTTKSSSISKYSVTAYASPAAIIIQYAQPNQSAWVCKLPGSSSRFGTVAGVRIHTCATKWSEWPTAQSKLYSWSSWRPTSVACRPSVNSSLCSATSNNRGNEQ